MGSYHLSILKKNPQAEVVALCDLKADLAQNLAKQNDIPKTFTDLKEVIADPAIDAIVVALPVYLHAPVTIAALNAGKHVLVEKPMAATSINAQEMLDTARRNNLILSIHHNQRFDPETVFLREYIAHGNLGFVHFCRCVWTRPYGVLPDPSRNWFNEKDKGGGVLFDLGTHLLDKILSLFDFPEATQFAASSFTVLGKEQERLTGARFDADDLTVGMIQFANGMTLQLEMGFGSHIEHEVCYYELYGEKGGVNTLGGLKIFSVMQGTPFITRPAHELPRATIPTVQDDFIDAIINHRSPVITPESAIKVTKILEGLRNAAQKGWGKPGNIK